MNSSGTSGEVLGAEGFIWDAIVIGAGPAGSVSAARLAERGWRVLLVEKSSWPREKPCGGCLNARAVGLLRQAGLDAAIAQGVYINRMTLAQGSRRLSYALPEGLAIDRRELDAGLVTLARSRGVHFLSQTHARLEPLDADGGAFRSVRLAHAGRCYVERARIVLACDGLHGASLAHESWASRVYTRPGRLGFSATIDQLPLAAGELSMLVGAAGYVGLVRLADQRTHIGAALWPQACHEAGGPGPLINGILHAVGMPPLPAKLGFRGTGLLTTQRPCVAGERVLAIGDSCGYIEPFTGEGIAWAVAGAVAATDLLPAHAGQWNRDLPARWQARFEATVRRRQAWCWRLRGLLRHPRLAAACLSLGRLAPGVPARIARRISA